MTASTILLLAALTGQYPYNPYNPYQTGGYRYGYGYGYGPRTPLPTYDPVRYARYYSGEGLYGFAPPVIANPEVINLRPPATTTPVYSQPAAPTSYVYQPITPPTVVSQPVTPAPNRVTTSQGLTGQVLALNEPQRQITLQLPTGTTTVPYGANTHFLSSDGNFPVIKPGAIISVNQNTITVLRRAQP
jgi:hypothetical protein